MSTPTSIAAPLLIISHNSLRAVWLFFQRVHFQNFSAPRIDPQRFDLVRPEVSSPRRVRKLQIDAGTLRRSGGLVRTNDDVVSVFGLLDGRDNDFWRVHLEEAVRL